MRIYDYFLLALMMGILVGGCSLWLFTRMRIGSETEWNDRFKAIALDTLRGSHEDFLKLAEGRLKQSELAHAATLDKKSVAIDEMLKPVRDTLAKMDTQIRAMETSREGAYRELMTAVGLSNDTQQKLREETGQLLQALRTPGARGRWGEIQVKRILEMTGMAEHTQDFTAQQYVPGEDKGFLRPDYVVRMPGDRCVVIDSKVPLTAYLDGAQSDDANFRQASMLQHAKQMREHIRALGGKAYWDQIDGAADFAVLFVPGDHFLSGALDCDPDLIEYGQANNVVVATPTTLLALLRTVALSWRQESLHENARKLGELGGELYGAVAVMTGHVSTMGDRLSGAIDSYNKLVGSMERNVLSKARKLRDYGANKEGKEIGALEPLDKAARPVLIEKDDAA